MTGVFKATELSDVGLNLQAVINLKDLPADLLSQLASNSSQFNNYTQLILIGHGGKRLWRNIQLWRNDTNCDLNDPIDYFSRVKVQEYFAKDFLAEDFEVIFPYAFNKSNEKQLPLGLQSLGTMVGWHNESPFKVGINQQWGSWFAYRAVVLAKSDYECATGTRSVSPCISCDLSPCIKTCPANALSDGKYDFDGCISYRKTEDSQCKDRCIARMACPVAKLQQYDIEQINYHYTQSLQSIEK